MHHLRLETGTASLHAEKERGTSEERRGERRERERERGRGGGGREGGREGENSGGGK